MDTYRLLHSAADMLTEIAGLPMLLGNYAFVTSLIYSQGNKTAKCNKIPLVSPTPRQFSCLK